MVIQVAASGGNDGYYNRSDTTHCNLSSKTIPGVSKVSEMGVSLRKRAPSSLRVVKSSGNFLDVNDLRHQLRQWLGLVSHKLILRRKQYLELLEESEKDISDISLAEDLRTTLQPRRDPRTY